ncbi:UBC6 [Symbiodinium sp. CCMP2592]|nr:UBC6 [Symbiodinium sp. CCMP2592]
MLRQIEGVRAITNSLADESTRQQVLCAQAHSLLQQLKATVITGDMVEQCTRAIQESPFTDSQKDTFLTALSEKVLQSGGDGKKVKKTTQELEDIGPFLSEEDVQYLTKTELNSLAKVTRLAEVYARVGCTNPTENTCGKAVSFLKEYMHVPGLTDPPTFLKSVQDFKVALKSAAKKVPAPSMHIAKFTTPEALPDEVAKRLFAESKPSDMQSGPVAIYGPLRKSHKSITGGTTSTAAPSSFQHGMMGGMMAGMPMMPSMMPMSVHGSPVMSMQQMMQTYAQQYAQQCLGQQGPRGGSLPNLVFFNQGGQQGHQNQESFNQPGQQATVLQKQLTGGDQQSAPGGELVPFTQPQGEPRVQQNQSETKPPMTAAAQAEAMLDAWNNRKQLEKDDKEDKEDDETMMKKPAAAMKAKPKAKSTMKKVQAKAKAKAGKAAASPKQKAAPKVEPPKHVLKKMPKHERAKYRSSIKRSREEDLASLTGVFGPLVQQMEVPVEGKHDKNIVVPYIHPASFLKHVFSLAPLWDFLRQEVLPHKERPSYGRPGGLIFYADEVTPGNTLKSNNSRKMQCIYWSISELGSRGLSSEALWFPLTCLRSHLCSSIGALTCLWRLMLRLFFTEHDMRKGILVDTPEGDHFPMFLDLKILVADEAAIKQSIEGKGASGTVFCCRCSNVVAARSAVSDMRSEFVSSFCTDYSKFRLHTNATTRDFLAFLDAQHGTISKAHFEALEKALGFNLRVHGLLMDDIIGHKVPEAIMFDFFHIYLVHGIVGNELGFFFGMLRDAGFGEDQLRDFVSSFRWPKQFASPDATRVFAKREKKTSAVKAEASELLNALPVLRFFVLKFVMKAAISPDTVQACMCFLLLCKVIDMLHDAVRGRAVDPKVLHDTIVKHSNCLLETYGEDVWVPKNHMSLHLGEFLAKFGHLVWCFTHERKHKVVKRFANQKLDGSRGFEDSVLKDVLAVQLNCMSAELPSSKVRLMNPKPAPKKLVALVEQVMPLATGTILHDLRAMHGGGFVCTKGDVVAFDATSVSQVQFQFQAAGQVWTCVTPWKHVHEHMFESCTDLDPFITATDSIQSCCIYSEKDGKAIVLV